LTGDDKRLRNIMLNLLFKHQITDESKIRDILRFIKHVIEHRSIDTEVLIDLIKLLRTLETRKQGGTYKLNCILFQDRNRL
jgi:hypothetical protein